MKKGIALILSVLFAFTVSGCMFTDSEDVSEDYIVLEATDTYLLVAQIGEDGKAIETMQYTTSNLFYPSVQIKAGDVINIKHSGVVLETYPMQFAKIYSMAHSDKGTGHTTTVYPD